MSSSAGKKKPRWTASGPGIGQLQQLTCNAGVYCVVHSRTARTGPRAARGGAQGWLWARALGADARESFHVVMITAMPPLGNTLSVDVYEGSQVSSDGSVHSRKCSTVLPLQHNMMPVCERQWAPAKGRRASFRDWQRCGSTALTVEATAAGGRRQQHAGDGPATLARTAL